ncbi:MAG: hypothetical protein WC635_09190 [Bacteriovorax sp.]|jgi:hypothetical protein
MKSSLFHILFISFISALSANAIANSCTEAVNEFKETSASITNRKSVSNHDLQKYQDAFEKLKILTEDEPCYKATLESTRPLRSQLKEKRIETLNKFFKDKVYEEEGVDLVFEYAVLTGKKKGKIEFEELFTNITARNVKSGQLNYDVVAKAAKANNLQVRQNNKCTGVINQNEAVNLENTRNQDSVGWCYAYTAADLLSFRLKKKISAVSLYNSQVSIQDDINTVDGTGGDISKSITEYLKKKNSLCLEEDLPSSDFQFCTYANYVSFLRSLYQSVQNNTLTNSQCLNQNLKAAFPGANFQTVKAYTRKYGTKNLAEYLSEFQCKKKSFVGFKVTPIDRYLPRFDKETLLKNMDEILNKGEIVGLAFQYEKMTESKNDNRREGGHAAVVVGRRQNSENGDCEYLIRNSWGKDCTDEERTGFTCDKKCDKSGCRYSGHLWVSQRRIKNSIKGITYLP